MTDEKNDEKNEEKKHEDYHEEKNHNNNNSSNPSNKNKTLKKVTKELSGNYWAISTIVLAVVLLLFVLNPSASPTGNAISEKEAGDIVINFAEVQGLEASLVGVKYENGLYQVTVTIQDQDVPVYLTSDGKGLIPSQPIPIAEVLAQAQQRQAAPTQQAPAPTEVPKSDKPKVELFVMSFCPYGNRGEDTLLPVYELLKDKVDWNINYIVSVSGDKVSSLHGQPETDQNIREVCVKNEYGLDKFWEFITYVNENCGRDGSCWEDGAKEIGLDENKIQSCLENEGLELMKNEAAISGAAGASGSPTMLVNGVKTDVVYQYENSEAYKEAICSAFTEAPEECSQALGSVTSASAGGSC